MTDWMVLMAATPSQPAVSAVLAGMVMSAVVGVLLAQTGMLALWLTQPQASCIACVLCHVAVWPVLLLLTLQDLFSA